MDGGGGMATLWEGIQSAKTYITRGVPDIR